MSVWIACANYGGREGAANVNKWYPPPSAQPIGWWRIFGFKCKTNGKQKSSSADFMMNSFREDINSKVSFSFESTLYKVFVDSVIFYKA